MDLGYISNKKRLFILFDTYFNILYAFEIKLINNTTTNNIFNVARKRDVTSLIEMR